MKLCTGSILVASFLALSWSVDGANPKNNVHGIGSNNGNGKNGNGNNGGNGNNNGNGNNGNGNGPPPKDPEEDIGKCTKA